MIALKLNWIKDNAEVVVCFGLLGLLVWVGVYFIGIEKTRAMLLSESGRASREIPKTGRVGREIGLIQQRSFLGLLITKPPSYYNSIVRRNPFARLPAFDPRKGPDTVASDLEVTSTLLLPEGQWAARIRNKRTGATYYVKKGNEIAGKFKMELDNKLITRTKNTSPQVKLEKEQRAKNIQGAFELHCRNVAQRVPTNILLIDDVITTGATMSECAKVLKQNGAKKVWGLAVARG